jgi:hypothetical protein
VAKNPQFYADFKMGQFFYTHTDPFEEKKFGPYLVAFSLF